MYARMRCAGAPAAAMFLLALSVPPMIGCVDGARDLTLEADRAPLSASKSRSIGLQDALPFVEPILTAEVFIQRLPEPTPFGENVALHVKLPPPTNKNLTSSDIRVVGEPKNPLVLFRAEALRRLKQIPESPGPDFFTTFVHLDARELDRRLENEAALDQDKFGRTSEKMIVFGGRSPVAVTTGIRLDRRGFDLGRPIPLGSCPILPVSDFTSWGESLLVRDPAVVLDPARTWNPCTGAGTQGGVWTFAHLMRELAQGSGATAETFVLEWLTNWLNDYPVNGDQVSNRRAEMYSQVIAPWATASGVLSSLIFNPIDNRFEVDLSGPLNLDVAPFRLLAIVNRLDLGKTVDGPSGYGGGVTSQPVDAGELRFVFGVVAPHPSGTEASCGLKDFTVIFEYGVPITGCSNVVQWARDWTQLNTYGGFTSSYRAHLASLTQSVVVHGAAPGKGNQNALNQIRTNDGALGSPHELREFTLTDENPAAGTDTPSNGLLRPHTVAQTPNDAAHPPLSSPDVDDYVLGPVLLGVAPAASCSASYTVPYAYNGGAFRGGNSLTSSGHWEAGSVNPGDVDEVCARHQFSRNTCNGCHLGDTATSFTHIDPTSGIPAALSGFLTGGGPGMGHAVPDTQFGTPEWIFADLERRFKRLYTIALCTECTKRFGVSPSFIDFIAEVAGVVPIDPITPTKPGFKIGPISDLQVIKSILDARIDFTKPELKEDIPIDFVRPVEPRLH